MEIAGKQLRMKYTVNALCAVESRAGVSLDALMARQFSAVRLLLWGGLMECQPDLRPEDVGDLMDAALRGGETLEGIVEKCAEALQEAGFIAPPAD